MYTVVLLDTTLYQFYSNHNGCYYFFVQLPLPSCCFVFSYAGYGDNFQWMLQPSATTQNGGEGDHRPPQTWDVTP